MVPPPQIGEKEPGLRHTPIFSTKGEGLVIRTSLLKFSYLFVSHMFKLLPLPVSNIQLDTKTYDLSICNIIERTRLMLRIYYFMKIKSIFLQTKKLLG